MNTHPTEGPVTVIPLNLLVPSPTNPRKKFDPAELESLAHSIRRHGILQPLLVRPMRSPDPKRIAYEIVAGERRYRAAGLCNLTEIPVRVRELSDQDTVEIQLIENVQRTDLDPMEEALGYQRLMKEHGLSVVDLIEATGKARSTIYGRLALLKMSPPLVKALTDGTIDYSIADLIARLPNAAQQSEALEMAERNRYSVREMRQQIDRFFLLDLQRASFDVDDATLDPKAGTCRDCPYNSCASPELFPGIAPWTCTNKPCFVRKTTLASELKLAGLKQAGATVIGLKEAKKLFPYEINPDSVSDDRLVTGNRPCYYAKPAKNGNYPTFEKLAEVAKVEPIVTLNPHTGNLVELYDRTKVVTAVKKTKPNLIDEGAVGIGSKPQLSGEERKQQIEENRRRRESESKRVNRLISATADVPAETFWWRLIIPLLDFRQQKRLREQLHVEEPDTYTGVQRNMVAALESISGVAIREHLLYGLLRINDKEVNTFHLEQYETLYGQWLTQPAAPEPQPKPSKRKARACQ